MSTYREELRARLAVMTAEKTRIKLEEYGSTFLLLSFPSISLVVGSNSLFLFKKSSWMKPSLARTRLCALRVRIFSLLRKIRMLISLSLENPNHSPLPACGQPKNERMTERTPANQTSALSRRHKKSSTIPLSASQSEFPNGMNSIFLMVCFETELGE